jgi:hypothetical protein
MSLRRGAESHSKCGRGFRILDLSACLLILAAIVAVGCEGGELEKSKIPELRKIANETPTYPGFEKFEEKVVVKTGRVSLFIFYRSPTSQFSDVKQYYDEVLPKNGWGPPQQLPPSGLFGENAWVSYRRNDYVIVVEQDGSKPQNFDVVVKWDPE